MFLLDTCVLSELRRPGGSEAVQRWLAAQSEDSLFVSVVTIGEVRFGVEPLPLGKRGSRLEAWLEELKAGVQGRVLPVDARAAEVWGVLWAEAIRTGQPLANTDGLIAATALRHGLTVVTRNVKDFEPTGAAVVDPWRG